MIDEALPSSSPIDSKLIVKRIIALEGDTVGDLSAARGTPD